MTSNPKRPEQGFSLVELMIGILLGAIIIAAAASMFGSTLNANTEVLRSARLNQDLSTVMEIMVSDIRRAGFTDDQVSYDDTTMDLNLPANLPDGNCVLYSYNRSRDGTIDANEWFGFERRSDAVRMRNSCSAGATCSSDCSTGNWERVTDPNVVTISALTLSATGSKCYSLETDNYWITTSDTATTFPCSETNASNLTTYIYDGSTSPATYNSGTYVAPIAGDRLVETRQVNITLTGNLTADANVTKELNAQVKIRNDRIRIAP